MEDDADAFEAPATTKRRKFEQQPLPGAPPVAPAAVSGKGKAARARTSSASDTKASTDTKGGRGVGASKAAAKVKAEASPAPRSPGKRSERTASVDDVTLSPNGKRVRQATLNGSGVLKAPLPKPDSDPIVDAQPSNFSDDDIFFNRCKQLFLCVAARAVGLERRTPPRAGP